jgi:hypothetical protein
LIALIILGEEYKSINHDLVDSMADKSEWKRVDGRLIGESPKFRMAASSQAAARNVIGSALLQREEVSRIPMLSCRLTQWGGLYRNFVWEVHNVLYSSARRVSAVLWSEPTIKRVTASSPNLARIVTLRGHRMKSKLFR